MNKYQSSVINSTINPIYLVVFLCPSKTRESRFLFVKIKSLFLTNVFFLFCFFRFFFFLLVVSFSFFTICFIFNFGFNLISVSFGLSFLVLLQFLLARWTSNDFPPRRFVRLTNLRTLISQPSLLWKPRASCSSPIASLWQRWPLYSNHLAKV